MSVSDVSLREKRESAEQGTRAGRTYLPDVDICETKEAFLVWADLPGVDEKSVDVHLDEGLLSITGSVSLEDYAGLRPVSTEHNIGNFSQRFRVSSDIDAARIRARMVNGVLELELPKAEHVRPKRIPVTSGS